MVADEQDSTPLATSIILLAAEAVPAFIRILLEIIRLFDPNTTELGRFPPLMVRLVHIAVGISMVTVWPLLMKTSSPEVGTDKPPQVDVEFQLPDVLDVRVAAWATEIRRIIESAKALAERKKVFIILFLVF